MEDKRCCKACLKTLDITSFYKDKSRKSGFREKCKLCVRDKVPIFKEPIILDDLKRCKICKEYKEFSFFYNSTTEKDGIRRSCIQCEREYYLNNKINIAITSKNHRDNNKERLKEEKRQYYIKNKKKIFKARQEKGKIDPLYRLRVSVSKRIQVSMKRLFKGMYEKSAATKEIIGCEISHLKSHIESQFECWMNWDNYGKYDGNYRTGWDLDHIIPVVYAKNEDEFYILNHWSNFQPLCSRINRDEKRDKVYPLTNLELSLTVEDNMVS